MTVSFVTKPATSIITQGIASESNVSTHSLTIGNNGTGWGMFASGTTGSVQPIEIDGVRVAAFSSDTATTLTSLAFTGSAQPGGVTTYRINVLEFGAFDLQWDGARYSANVAGFAAFLEAKGVDFVVPFTPVATSPVVSVNTLLEDTTALLDATELT